MRAEQRPKRPPTAAVGPAQAPDRPARTEGKTQDRAQTLLNCAGVCLVTSLSLRAITPTADRDQSLFSWENLFYLLTFVLFGASMLVRSNKG